MAWQGGSPPVLPLSHLLLEPRLVSSVEGRRQGNPWIQLIKEVCNLELRAGQRGEETVPGGAECLAPAQLYDPRIATFSSHTLMKDPGSQEPCLISLGECTPGNHLKGGKSVMCTVIFTTLLFIRVRIRNASKRGRSLASQPGCVTVQALYWGGSVSTCEWRHGTKAKSADYNMFIKMWAVSCVGRD